MAPARALGGLDLFRERMHALFRQFPGSLLITRPDVGEAIGVPFMTPPEPVEGEFGGIPPSSVDPESIAFVQLTSGSTKQPKAVRISHRALIANVRNTLVAGEAKQEDSLVTWLPFYHDMGLIGSLFAALGLGSDLHVMQPETFVARPRTWLQLISDLPSPAVSTAPNFAFQNCVQKIKDDQLESLDLSRWRLAGCGAERVREETLAQFADRFAVVGFRPEAFVPCYGMAETTLAVTFGAGGKIPRIDSGNVSCGKAIGETEIEIRSRDGEALSEGEEGEIAVRSSSLFSGYAGADSGMGLQDGWLLTGDRGYLRDGELYVTGRYKDLIIVDGVNIDPDEIEAVAELANCSRGGRSAAFSVDVEGRERVVLVIETTQESPEALAKRHRDLGDGIARNFGFNLYDVLFLRRGSIKKTSSGKVQRSKLRELFLEEKLDSLWRQRDQRVEEPPAC
jgi:acyl-CoA synthetase (AMP-forming)/AMP-acid ligase II